MSATTWLIIAVVGFSLAGIALVVAIFIFIKMKIPAVIGDLTGKTVAREIKAMRDVNSSNGNKISGSSSANINRCNLAETLNDEETVGAARAAAHASKRLDSTGSGSPACLKKSETGHPSVTRSKGRTTESLSSTVEEIDIEERRPTAVLSQDRVTDVLDTDRKTAGLCEAPGTAILSETSQTEILLTGALTDEKANMGRVGTTVLSEVDELLQETVKTVAFKVTRSVIKIHTDEVV